jgi:hypothetical protein
MCREVWNNKGWDTDLITQNSKDADIRWTAQGGQCYRVRIMSAGKRGVQGEGTTSQMLGQSRKRKRRGNAGEDANADAFGNVGAPVSESESESNSSSGSNSSKQNRKNKKKNKEKRHKDKTKEKAMKNKRKAKDHKLQEKEELQNQKKAALLKQKAGAVVASLEKSITHPAAYHVPQSVLHPVQVHIKTFREVCMKCDRTSTFNEIDAQALPWKDAKAAEKLLLSIIPSIQVLVSKGMELGK